MVRSQGTGVLHLPSNKINGKRGDRLYVLPCVLIGVFGSTTEEVAFCDNVGSTINIGGSFVCSNLGSRG